MKQRVIVQTIPIFYKSASLPKIDSGRVLHLFERSVNIAFDQIGIVSVVAPEIGPGPFTLVLSESFDWMSSLSIDTSIEWVPGRIIAGNIEIDFSRADAWDPAPAWDRLDAEKTSWAWRLLREILNASDIQPAALDYEIPEFWNEQATVDLANVLAGLGPGLTPSGDDILVGAMHALWATFPEDQAEKICGWIYSSAAPRTTTLSGAWLKAAKAGQAGNPWHLLVEAIFIKNEARLRRAAKMILSTGHTSGADALSGFLKVIRL